MYLPPPSVNGISWRGGCGVEDLNPISGVCLILPTAGGGGGACGDPKDLPIEGGCGTLLLNLPTEGAAAADGGGGGGGGGGDDDVEDEPPKGLPIEGGGGGKGDLGGVATGDGCCEALDVDRGLPGGNTGGTAKELEGAL